MAKSQAGYLGVHRSNGRYRARIRYDGKQRLGVVDNERAIDENEMKMNLNVKAKMKMDMHLNMKMSMSIEMKTKTADGRRI